MGLKGAKKSDATTLYHNSLLTGGCTGKGSSEACGYLVDSTTGAQAVSILSGRCVSRAILVNVVDPD